MPEPLQFTTERRLLANFLLEGSNTAIVRVAQYVESLRASPKIASPEPRRSAAPLAIAKSAPRRRCQTLLMRHAARGREIEAYVAQIERETALLLHPQSLETSDTVVDYRPPPMLCSTSEWTPSPPSAPAPHVSVSVSPSFELEVTRESRFASKRGLVVESLEQGARRVRAHWRALVEAARRTLRGLDEGTRRAWLRIGEHLAR